MGGDDAASRLSRLSTDWGIFQQAHAGAGVEVRAAQELLVRRYGGPARRYLKRVVGDADPDAVDDLFQEFAVALVGGGLRGADPAHGRFRDYVKTVLRNLVARHHAKRRRRPQTARAAADGGELKGVAAPDPREDILDEEVRAEFLARAWDALRDAWPSGYTVLRLKAENPRLGSEEMAAALTRDPARPVTPVGVRQTLHRARKQLARLLVDEVGRSVADPTPDAVRRELADLDLLEYCKPALGG